MSHQNRYQTPAYLKLKKRKLIIKISLISFLAVVLCVAFVYLFNYHKFQIVSVKISDTQFVEQNIIKEQVENLLEDRTFLIFKKTNFLFIPKTEISKILRDQFLPISGVKVRVENKIVQIQVEEFKAVAKYCQNLNIEDVSNSEILLDNKNTDGKESCFLVNRDGLIFYEISGLDKLDVLNSGIVEFRGLNLEGNPLGLYYLDSERFDTLYGFVDSLSKIDIKAVSVDTDDLETFKVKIEDGPDLLIESNDESAETLINNLKTTIEIEEINKIQFKNLEYIDLRFGKNIYYKIK